MQKLESSWSLLTGWHSHCFVKCTPVKTLFAEAELKWSILIVHFKFSGLAFRLIQFRSPFLLFIPGNSIILRCDYIIVWATLINSPRQYYAFLHVLLYTIMSNSVHFKNVNCVRTFKNNLFSLRRITMHDTIELWLEDNAHCRTAKNFMMWNNLNRFLFL